MTSPCCTSCSPARSCSLSGWSAVRDALSTMSRYSQSEPFSFARSAPKTLVSTISARAPAGRPRLERARGRPNSTGTAPRPQSGQADGLLLPLLNVAFKLATDSGSFTPWHASGSAQVGSVAQCE